MALNSFIPVSQNSHFPIHNIPFGVFSPKFSGLPRVGVAIGDFVLDLSVVQERNFFIEDLKDKHVFSQPSLNSFMALGKPAWKEARLIIQNLLRQENPAIRDDSTFRSRAFYSMKDITMHLPVEIGDYTDFYASKEHAANLGKMFRGAENALLPNWLHLPVAYHGRASSIILSGEDVQRPIGQIKSGEENPTLQPTRELDFELEMGYLIGTGNTLGKPISVNQAIDHIFGMVLVNDWSARDIQKWEYQPLGPFLGKNFATSISPWVVTMDALEPFRCSGPIQDPKPLPYLYSSEERAYDIDLEVRYKTRRMSKPTSICKTNFRYLYWNICQQLAHHTINGCNMRPGDLLASGTISGSTPDSYGSMIELTEHGNSPIQLPGGKSRSFLDDGDEVTLTGWCQGDGYRVGFGEVKTTILPAKQIDQSLP